MGLFWNFIEVIGANSFKIVLRICYKFSLVCLGIRSIVSKMRIIGRFALSDLTS